MKRIIEKPILTEKMTAQSEKLNRYGFVVSKDANKIEIKNAVEKLYGVAVDSEMMDCMIIKKILNTRLGIF
jgi:large subunit ribosomal protein L23